MRVRFLKSWSGGYGVFTKGRIVELAGPMLAACPRDVYEEVKEEPDAKKADTPAKNKQARRPKNEGGKNKGKKVEQVE